MNCCIGHGCGLDLVLLCLVAAAPIQPLALELLYAAGADRKKKKIQSTLSLSSLAPGESKCPAVKLFQHPMESSNGQELKLLASCCISGLRSKCPSFTQASDDCSPS